MNSNSDNKKDESINKKDKKISLKTSSRHKKHKNTQQIKIEYGESTASIKIDGIKNKTFEIESFTYLEEISNLKPVVAYIIDDLYLIDDKVLDKNVEILLNIKDHITKYSKEYREKKILGYIKNFSIERKKTILGYKKNFIKIKIYPFIYKLNNSKKRKIFYNKNLIEIIEDIFKFRNFEKYKFNLKKNLIEYEKKEFTIQFDESDLEFILRLLETNGFYYYISYLEEKQIFLISDRLNSYKKILGNELEIVDEISTSGCFKEITSPRVYQNKKDVEFFLIHDYNHEKSNINLAQKSNTSKFNTYEINYDFDYSTTKEGEYKISLFESQSKFKTNIFAFKTRRVINLFDKFKTKGNSNGINWAIGEYYAYRIFTIYKKNLALFKIRSVKTDFAFVKKPTFKKPKIIGSQLALVVGKKEESSEEVYVDKFLTILIKFMWQQIEGNKKNNEPGIKVRVSQLLGGKSSSKGLCGIWVIPRIGQEVIVTFINGDPDRPVITGVVLNSDNLSIFDKESIQNGLKKIAIRTATIPNAKDGHELIFDDENDKQKITLSSSKDYDVIVANNTLFKLKNNYDTFVEEGNYSITMKKGNINIILDKGGINIKSTDNIKIDCSKELNIKANKIVIESDTSIETKAQNGIKFNSKSFEVSAIQGIKFNANIGEIKINAKLDISGSFVNFESKGIFNIKSTGPLNLNGAIISLN
ncbi:type VI secretion system Vgr family protein [Pigmentibacter ruber]|nr:hypothetical protein GTC16762_13660 [Pigmentibacter ruber]